ncbi:MAG: hypothetical protein ACI9UR_000591 [Bacteroidia bacterium]|jgi:hypothetical protein
MALYRLTPWPNVKRAIERIDTLSTQSLKGFDFCKPYIQRRLTGSALNMIKAEAAANA